MVDYSTPELVRAYALDDEQALLAILRYNRLIDTFLGLTTFSLQNHLRTTVKGIGQIEIDELYLGIDRDGCHYAIPVQAKGGKDQISVIQTKQDVFWVQQKFPEALSRPQPTRLAVGYSGGINQGGRHSSYSTNIRVSSGAQALVPGAPNSSIISAIWSIEL